MAGPNLLQHRQKRRCGFGVATLALLASSVAVIAQPYGLETRPALGPFLNNVMPKAPPAASGAWSVVQAFPSLTFDDPVFLTAEPRTNRLYVCERQGKIYWFVNNSATASKTLFLDLTAVTQGYDDCGLLGIAFHPQYGVAGSTNRGYVYVYYQFSENPTSGPNRPPSATPGFNRLSRFTVPDGSLVADRNSEQVLINQYDRHVWHNGGGMFFGPDGFLYLSNGDEGAANDSYSQSQEINSGLFSGVLRIDVDRDPSRSHPIRRQPRNDQSPPSGWTNVTFTANYYIPNDNPWLDAGGSVLEEFYAIGLRSPHRMTFDPATGDIWLGDIGQGAREEVDIIEKGGNYQWAYREGSINGPKSKPNPLIGVDKPPIYSYARSAGDTCVIGGYVYRGSEHPSLFGKYIFGDNTSGRIWTMDYDGVNPPTVVELLDTGWPNNYSGLSSFGLDNNNELLICKMGRPSRIYKLARAGAATPSPPALLSQTGAFTNLATLTAAPALIPYDINSPLWSDGAEKQRWLAVPNDGAPYTAAETIGFATNGSWSWPTGTVLVKHFALRTNESNPNSLRRLETRFLVRGTNGGWHGFTYKWRPNHSDADLLTNSAQEVLTVATTSGTRTQTWYYPSRADCITCHNENANGVLGLRTCQMNGNVTYPQTGVTDNQLRALNHLGLFSPALNEAGINNLPRASSLSDTNVSLETRVRSYLDSNCAHCHRPEGVSALFDARFETPLGSQGLVEGEVLNAMGISGAKVIKSGNLSQSVLHVRDSLVGPGQMPPLARNLPDTQYLDVLGQWINSIVPPGAPPPPWLHQDVGPVGVAGDVTYSAGTFSVVASGVDIWDQADSFHFVHQPLSGDVTISARVNSIANTDPWAIGGVMIRQNLTAGSPHAIAAMTAQNGVSFTRRLTANAFSDYTAGTSTGAPYWVRLVRTGSNFAAYQSANGTSWTLVGSATIAMSGTVYVGLGWSSHNNSTLGTAVFDNVTVVIPATNQPPAIGAIANQEIDEDTVSGPLNFTISDAETAAASLLLSKTSSVPSLVPVENIVFGGAGSNRTVTLTPALNQHGAATITIGVSDGTNIASTGFMLTVLPVNDDPVAGADAVTRWASQGIRIPVAQLVTNDTDVDGDLLSLSSVTASPGSGASVLLSNAWVHYWPAAGMIDPDEFTYLVSDGFGGTATGAVSVAIQPEPPAFEQLSIQWIGESGLSLSLQGHADWTYTVQSTASLEPPGWLSVGVLVTDELGAASLTLPWESTNTARLYRVVRGVVP